MTTFYHFNFNVLDLDRSLAFYKEALNLSPVREKEAEDAIPALLVRQVRSSVYMEDSIRSMAELGLDAIVEIGPGKALSGFVKKTVPGFPVHAVETAADVEALEGLVKENG